MSVDRLRNRLRYVGGKEQNNRDVTLKEWSFKQALKNSYQAANIKKVYGVEEFTVGDEEHIPALMNNASSTIEDQDNKVLSVGEEWKFKAGDLFRWLNTDTYWIVYLQHKTELAYFRGLARRCDHIIKWAGSDRQLFQTYAAVIGPKNTPLATNIQKSIPIETSNVMIEVLVPKTIENEKYFVRGTNVIIDHNSFEIEVIDTISMPGVIQFGAKEAFIKIEDDDVEQQIDNHSQIMTFPEDNTGTKILGPTKIKPLSYYLYTTEIGISTTRKVSWHVQNSLKDVVDIQVNPNDQRQIKLKVTEPFSTKMILTAQTKDGIEEISNLNIIVESLF